MAFRFTLQSAKELLNQLLASGRKAGGQVQNQFYQKAAQVASSPRLNYAAQGFQRIRQSNPRQYFLPTAIGTPQTRASITQSGRVLQSVPRIGYTPPTPKKSWFPEPLPMKATRTAVDFLTRLPTDIIRGYGETATKYGTGQKLNVWDYANLTDFVPGLGFIGAGVKPIVREGGERLLREAGEKVFKEGVESTGQKAVKTFIEQGAEKTPLKGLLSESLAQTSFRRKAGLSLKDIYTKAHDFVTEFTHPRGLFKNIPPTKKVGILDYVRTPDRVLQKIGMGEEAKTLRNSWEAYKLELPKQLDKINDWYKQVQTPGSERKIFDYLDGTLDSKSLDQTELKVASEIKDYLKTWANRLGLPQEKRIKDYISHIFERGDIELEFDPELAKMIEGKIPGSVYDPFLEKRIGKPEYIHDVWRALDAYVKRATRKANLDPALSVVERAAKNLDVESYKYVQRLTAGVNMRPTEIDNLIDNFVKGTPVRYRFTQRPTAYISQKLRKWVFRGALGLNVGSAIRNLTQTVNTYSKLGERWTASGVFNFARKALSKDLDELYKVGVLNDSFIQDRGLSALKLASERMDKGLFFLFDWAEKINRGIAYYGAKSRALARGINEVDAIREAKEMVRTTQFTFGAVDTPVILQSDVAKTLLQFQSFNIKQAEFLAEMLKNKEFAGLFRYAISSLALVGILGKTLGYEIKDFIPFSGVFTGETKLGQTPPVQLGKGVIQAAVKAPDKYGNIPEGGFIQRLLENQDVQRALTAFVPGGVQARKTYEGLRAVHQGASLTPSGRERFAVEQTPVNYLKGGLLGQYSLPGAQEYFSTLDQSNAQILYNKLKKMSPEEAAATVKQLKNSNSSAYSSFIEYTKDLSLKATTKEKRVRALQVRNGSRARAIVSTLNSKKSAEAKAALYKRYKELGIITDEIEAQLKAARKAGALK